VTAFPSPAPPPPDLAKLADLAAELAVGLDRFASAGPPARPVPRPVPLKSVPDGAGAAVLVVDDRPLLAQGIRRVLESTPDLHLAGHSTSLRAAAGDVRALAPDVVLLNPRTGGELSAPELCSRIRVWTPQVKVLVLADGGNDALLTACQKAGVHGVVALGCTEAELVRALRAVLEAGEVGPGHPHPPQAVLDRGHERLRPREYDVLRLLAAGAGTPDVAARLGITTNTARSYTQSLMAKLHAHNRVQLLLTARTLGLV
jgi:two-component system, NarL family, invasion response regulator UvrY